MDTFTHLNEKGSASMVDVGQKSETQRRAVAFSFIKMSPSIIALLKDNKIPKGDVLATARIAGILASKKVDSLIPLCHSLAIDSAEILFQHREDGILVKGTVRITGKTGVEMEALTAVSVASLTIYDMCKAVDKGMVIGPTYLGEKTGGKSGVFRSPMMKDCEEGEMEWL